MPNASVISVRNLVKRFGTKTGLAVYLALVASTSFTAALAPEFTPECLAFLAVAYAGLMLVTAPRGEAAAPLPAPRDR